MGAVFLTSARSGLSVVACCDATAGLGGPDALDRLLRAGRPAELAAAAAAIGPLTESVGAEPSAPGSPTGVTRECYLSGTSWDPAARPLAATISACAKEMPQGPAWVEPLCDWACARNTLAACCAVSMSGEASLAERLASCGGSLAPGGARVPLARDPRRRDFRRAKGVLAERDERLLLRLGEAAERLGASVEADGDLVWLHVRADEDEIPDRILAVTWAAFARVAPKAARTQGHEAPLAPLDALSAATLALARHPARSVNLCKRCGRFFLQGTRPATFCSNACRTAWHQRPLKHEA